LRQRDPAFSARLEHKVESNPKAWNTRRCGSLAVDFASSRPLTADRYSTAIHAGLVCTAIGEPEIALSAPPLEIANSVMSFEP
jgi:hypothetical protein